MILSSQFQFVNSGNLSHHFTLLNPCQRIEWKKPRGVLLSSNALSSNAPLPEGHHVQVLYQKTKSRSIPYDSESIPPWDNKERKRQEKLKAGKPLDRLDV